MTIIKASCPECGESELRPADIDLQVCDAEWLSYYSFVCPQCLDVVKKPADNHIVKLLLSGGVFAHLNKLPDEAFEVHTGQPISPDDLLDFCVSLMDHDCLAEFV